MALESFGSDPVEKAPQSAEVAEVSGGIWGKVTQIGRAVARGDFRSVFRSGYNDLLEAGTNDDEWNQ